jgi:hypothetical protein
MGRGYYSNGYLQEEKKISKKMWQLSLPAFKKKKTLLKKKKNQIKSNQITHVPTARPPIAEGRNSRSSPSGTGPSVTRCVRACVPPSTAPSDSPSVGMWKHGNNSNNSNISQVIFII